MRILVVDDSKTVRFIMLKMLKELGYKTIDEACDVDQAWMKINLAIPDLIISDWNMPGKSGFDFLVEVRSKDKTKNIPFIMSTTVKDKDDIFQAIKAGLQAYLIKPCEKDVLGEKIKSLAGKYSLVPPKDFEEDINWKDSSNSTGETIIKSKDEKIKAVVDHFELLVHGELSYTNFRDWLAHDLLNLDDKHESQKKIDFMVDGIQDAAGKAIFDLLKKSDLL